MLMLKRNLEQPMVTVMQTKEHKTNMKEHHTQLLQHCQPSRFRKHNDDKKDKTLWFNLPNYKKDIKIAHQLHSVNLCGWRPIIQRPHY